MKKKLAILLTLLTLLSAGSALAQLDFSAAASFAYESEYVYRGHDLADTSFQPWAEVKIGHEYEMGPAKFTGAYFGAWLNSPIENGGITVVSGSEEEDLFLRRNFEDEVHFYGGFNVAIEDQAMVDIGFTYYWYPEETSIEGVPITNSGVFGLDYNRSREFYIGVSATQCMFNPAFYFYYDTDLEQTVFELSGSYTFDTSQWVEDTSVEIAAYWGLLDTGDIGAGQVSSSFFTEAGMGDENGYSYYGVTADLVYALTDYAKLSLGVRYAGNNDDLDSHSLASVLRGDTKREDSLWWGLSLTAGF